MMDKIKNFLKNKSVAYYMVACNVVLALFLTIFFFATFKKAMPNNAAGLAPQTIGIYMIAGLAIELVVLALPQYRFVHIAAVVMFGLSLYKEVIIIPNLIADQINNVFYQGGHLGISSVYIVLQFIIIISAIVAAFLGFYKDEKDATADMPVKGKYQICKASVGAAVLAIAVIAGTVTSTTLEKKLAAGTAVVTPDEEEYDPITDEIKEAANGVEYTFDPNTVLIKQSATYNFNDATLKAIKTNVAKRANVNLVYYFEGSYAEGYQGDYSETYAYLYLWDDGMFAGKSRDTEIRGYWYNSSTDNGKDEEGNDIKDCLIMVSNVDHYDSIITEEAGGFYERQAYIYLNMGWGQRSIIINGYKYSPEVAIYVDAQNDGQPIKGKVGDAFSTNSWVTMRVLKNLSYSAVFKQSEVKYTIPSGMLDKDGKLKETGEYEVTATWNGFSTKVKVIVEA